MHHEMYANDTRVTETNRKVISTDSNLSAIRPGEAKYARVDYISDVWRMCGRARERLAGVYPSRVRTYPCAYLGFLRSIEGSTLRLLIEFSNVNFSAVTVHEFCARSVRRRYENRRETTRLAIQATEISLTRFKRIN